MTDACQNCGTPLAYPGKGRPRERCEPCGQAYRREYVRKATATYRERLHAARSIE